MSKEKAIQREGYRLIPALDEGPDMYRIVSDDGCVKGIVGAELTRRRPYPWIVIYEWSSEWKIEGCRGEGKTVVLLQALRRDFRHIHAMGIGMDATYPSWTYWVHMFKKGLVDIMTDDEAMIVDVSSLG